jgi:hypothetical protein
MDPVASLHRALVDSLIERRPDALNKPVTVAEIYQDLIPYKSVRAPLGFALNADYEHALLQLLAGTDGFARIEPPEAREALGKELKSVNPDVGLFRDYAACDVFVTMPDELDQTHPYVMEAAPPPLPIIPEPAPKLSSESWEAVVNGASRADAGDAFRAFTPKPAAPAPPPVKADAKAATGCLACGKPLPSGKTVVFCPYCGADQTRLSCKQCSEPVEKDWKFCIACGAKTD